MTTTTSTTDQHRQRRRCRVLSGTAAGAALVLAVGIPSFGPAAAADRTEPTYATANVDGAPGEWTGADVFGSLFSDHPPHRQLATVSLRYDCATSVLYAYVAADAGVVLQTIDPGEDYLRLGSSGKLVDGTTGDDGIAPDFAWVGLSDTGAAGWEASAMVAEGSYPGQLRVHAKVPDGSADGYEVIDLQPRYHDLTIDCPEDLGVSTSTSSTTSTTVDSSTTEGVDVKPASQDKVPAAVAAAPASGTSAFTG